MVSGFCELALQTEQPRQLAKFYVENFGLRELSGEEEGVWLAVGDHARLGLWKPGDKQYGDEGGIHVHFAFSVSPGALETLAQRLRASGHHVRGPIEHDGGDRSLYLEDPEGNLIEAWDYFHRNRTTRALDCSDDANGVASTSSLLEEGSRG